MENRTKHTYQTTIYSFAKNVVVVCPKCEKKAIVQADDFDTSKHEIEKVKVVCTGCGFNKTLENI